MSELPELLDIQLLSERVRQSRKDAKLSQIELAQLVGVSDKAISSYEVGRAVPPLEVLTKISSVTGKHLSYFFSGESDMSVLIEKVDNMIEELHSLKKIFG